MSKQTDVDRLKDLEIALMDLDLDFERKVTIVVSVANLEWLVDRAGKWIRRNEDDRLGKIMVDYKP